MIRIVDIETTGEGIAAEVLEIASVDLDFSQWGNEKFIANPQEDLIKPRRPITPQTSAIHHITDDMVEDALPREEVLPKYAGADTYLAHYAEFEAQFLNFQSQPLCSFQMALHLWPAAPAHNLQTLRYWLANERPSVRERFDLLLDGRLPHRALPDVLVTAVIVEQMMVDMVEKFRPLPPGYGMGTHKMARQWEDWFVTKALVMTTEPALLSGNITFGKHAGAPWKDVPKGYLQWMSRQEDFDKNTLHTARHWLNPQRSFLP